MSAAGRNIFAACQIFNPRWRQCIAPRITPSPPGTQRVFKFRLTGQTVVCAGLLAQPCRISFGIARGDVNHWHGIHGRLPVIPGSPVNAAAAHEVAAAHVIGHRMPALGSARHVTGGLHKATELPHRDFVTPHRKSTLERYSVLGLFIRIGIDLTIGRPH